MDEPSARAANRETPAGLRLLFACLAVIWIIELGPAVRALVSGAPDLYHHQHWRNVTLSGGSLLLALSMLIKNRRLQWIGLSITYVLLGLNFALGR